MDQLLAEASPATTLTPQGTGSGRYRVVLIREGWGSSGYYSREVLERDGPRCWPAGTQQYLDHPTLSERDERPERSVKDWAGVIVTDPVWDDNERGLVAEVEVFPQWRWLLNPTFTEKVGLSVRAYGTAEHGEADGREGPIVQSLTEGISVDWVTRAGAGGRVLELIESARSVTKAVSDKPWSDFTAADYSIEQWRRACLIGPDSPSDSKSDYHLPVREPSGTVNRNGVHAAAARLNQVNAPTAKKQAAARKLVGLYKQLGETPPESVTKAAGQTGSATGTGTNGTGKNGGGKSGGKDDAAKPPMKTAKESAAPGAELEEAGRTVGAQLEAKIHTAFTVMADDLYGAGRLTRDERITLSSAFGDALATFVARVEKDAAQLYQRDPWSYPDDEATAGAEVAEAVRGTAKPPKSDGRPAEDDDEDDDEDDAKDPEDEQDDQGDDENPKTTKTAPGTTPAPKKMKEGAMPEITAEQLAQLEEAAKATQLLEKATQTISEQGARIVALEAQLAEAAKRDQARDNAAAARRRCEEALAESGLPAKAHPRVIRDVTRDLPTSDDGSLDTAALEEAIKTAIQEEKSYLAGVEESLGYGVPRGLGGTTGPVDGGDDDLVKDLEESFRAIGLGDEDAKTAAIGR